MQFEPGSRIGPYEVSGKLGEGGMGEVYRARDARLNRDVALKALPASFVADPDRIARFQREAQVLAALSHPHIASIYGLEDCGGAPALVMELVEGPTLAERIQAGAIPVDEAIAIARQLAEALEAAHEKGIVHRDLKPANIKLTPEGKVKVLDFGLAKALGNDPAESGNPANSPTITLTLESTRAGMILGSAGYMSPEQARGKPVDKRADIWAFGVIFYEMLTGHVAFEGETVTDSLAAILRADIEWHRLPAATPAWVRRLLERCLERDPKRRLRDIGDAWIEADAPAAAPPPGVPVAPPRANRWIPWAAGAVLATAGIAWGLLHRPPETPRPVVRSAFTQDLFFGLLSISRDGTRLAYCDTGANAPLHLVLRMEDQLTGRTVPGAESAVFPFFSPNGEWIGYFSIPDGRKLKKIPITGGTPITVTDSAETQGAVWADDDNIYFGSSEGVKRVPASGGTPQLVTRIDQSKGETAHSFPQVVAGRNALLFTITARGASRVAVADLKSNAAPGVIVESGSNARYVATGHLVYMKGNGLFAVPFDIKKLAVTGAEVPVIDGVSGVGNGAGDFDISATGTLVYMMGSEGAGRTVLAIADEKGAVQIVSDELAWGTGRLSPDGKRIANDIHNTSPDTGDIWVGEIARKTGIRLSFEGRNASPIWTRDGRRLYWGATVNGKTGIWSAPSDGSAKPQLFVETEAFPTPGSMTPDGKTLLYSLTPPGKKSEIWAVPVNAGGESGKPVPLRQSSFMENGPELSPDGKWLAYASTESGGREVYVQPYPGPGSKERISTQGGYAPRWSRDSRELYYWGGVAGNQLVRVPVQTTPAFRIGATEGLFNMAAGSTWDPAPDGKHFLVEQLPGGGSRRMITVVNWFEELRRRAPIKQ